MRLSKPGMTVLDIGANIGAYTLLFLESVGEQGKVICFEPNPEAYNRLLHNIGLNGYAKPNFHALPVALADFVGEADFYLPAYNHHERMISSFYRYRPDVEWVRVKVPVSTVDHLLTGDIPVSRVDLMKVDTEGSDRLVLIGARQTITRYRPILIFEVAPKSWPEPETTIPEVLKELRRLGYRLHTVGFGGQLVAAPLSGPVSGDVVALPG